MFLDIFTYLITYLPYIIAVVLNVLILVFAIFIYQRNSYNYGIFLMISAILLIASNVLSIAIQYPHLPIILETELGMPIAAVTLIMATWGFVFLSLNTTSAIFLIVSLSMIYNTHHKQRTGG